MRKRDALFHLALLCPSVEPLGHLNHTAQGMRLVARIDAWPLQSHWPEGHFVRVLGPVNSIDAETEALMIENNLSATPFGDVQV
jgi:exoribonuclease R